MSNERSALPKLNIGLPNECCMLAREDNKITITKVEENKPIHQTLVLIRFRSETWYNSKKQQS